MNIWNIYFELDCIEEEGRKSFYFSINVIFFYVPFIIIKRLIVKVFALNTPQREANLSWLLLKCVSANKRIRRDIIYG